MGDGRPVNARPKARIADDLTNLIDPERAADRSIFPTYVFYFRATIAIKAKSDWILSLDTDELVSLELAAEIKAVLKKSEYEAYYIPFQNQERKSSS